MRILMVLLLVVLIAGCSKPITTPINDTVPQDDIIVDNITTPDIVPEPVVNDTLPIINDTPLVNDSIPPINDSVVIIEDSSPFDEYADTSGIEELIDDMEILG